MGCAGLRAQWRCPQHSGAGLRAQWRWTRVQRSQNGVGRAGLEYSWSWTRVLEYYSAPAAFGTRWTQSTASTQWHAALSTVAHPYEPTYG